MSAPVIYHLAIERFRCITTFSWHPAKGVNLILGGGDVGKTTILDAIGLLLSPTNLTTLADTDYHARNIGAGFAIEAIVSLPTESGISQQTKASWPWDWKGSEAVVPSTDSDGGMKGEPVYRLRVRGTEDLELAYEIVQPDGTPDSLSVGLRRSIGLVRLSGDERNDRDLRLVQGSALDRLLSDKALRSRLASELAKSDVAEQLTGPAKEALKALNLVFKTKSLPDGLDLAITGGQGLSITALIGLTAKREGVQLPLASWGSGTRRFAALAIAEQNQGEAPITLVDEVERKCQRKHTVDRLNPQPASKRGGGPREPRPRLMSRDFTTSPANSQATQPLISAIIPIQRFVMTSFGSRRITSCLSP